MSLTQTQYCSLIGLLQSIPRVLDVESGSETATLPSNAKVTIPDRPRNNDEVESPTSLGPELQPTAPTGESNTLPGLKTDLLFKVNAIRLSLYNEQASHESDFKTTGIVRFSLNGNAIALKQLSDGSMEADIKLQTFTMNNIRPSNSKFREIIPAEKNREQPQLSVLYTSSGAGASPSSLAIISIASPKILLALDPTFALLGFLTSAFPPSETPAPPIGESSKAVSTRTGAAPAETSPSPQPSTLAFRFDMHDASIIVLEDDEQINSQAIRLAIKQVSVTQQVI